MLSRGPSVRQWLVLLATLLAVLLTARLGFWQLDRARQKLDLQERIASRAALAPVPQAMLARDAAAAEGQFYRPISLRGRWLTERTVYLDNRQMNARQGFFVVTPLLLANGDAVLVQRGWSPRDFSDRTRLQPLATPGGEVLVPGRIAPPPSKLFALGGAESGAIRQNLDLVALAGEIGVALRPLSVQQTAAASGVDVDPDRPAALAEDGLLRQWPAPAVDVGKHHGYAFQWFALCALITGLFVWFQLLRPRVARSPDVRSL
jgi:surfeit locus 1 family protein